jgi:hypothetical protein
MPEVIPFAAEKANLVLNVAVNAALEHVSAELGVSKSNYVDSLLRVKFGLSLDDLLCRYLKNEGITVPQELASFSSETIGKSRKKPGSKPRLRNSQFSTRATRDTNIAVGNHGPVNQSITKRKGL